MVLGEAGQPPSTLPVSSAVARQAMRAPEGGLFNDTEANAPT